MPANEPTWTAERLELLKRHFAAGLSCREIAADIGVSRNAVIGKLARLNLTRGRAVSERRAERKAAASARGQRTVPRLQYAMLAAIYGETDAAPAPECIDETNRCSLMELSEGRC